MGRCSGSARVALPAVLLFAFVVAGRTALPSDGVEPVPVLLAARDVRALAFEPLGSLGGSYTAVASDGRLLYAVRGDRLDAIEPVAGDPPLRVTGSTGSIVAPRASASVAAAPGGRAYVIERVDDMPPMPGHDDLTVVDVTDPAAPVVGGTLELERGRLRALAVTTATVYAASGNLGLSVIDVSGADAPGLAATVDVGGVAHAVALTAEGLLLVGVDPDDGFGALAVLDVRDRLVPRRIGSVELKAAPVAALDAGRYALVAAGDAIVTVDLAAPSDPRVVGELHLDEAWVSLALAGDRLFAVAARQGVRGSVPYVLVDTGHLPALALIGKAYEDHGGQLVAYGVEGVVQAAGPRGLRVLGQGPPEGPVVVEEERLPTLGSPTGVDLVGDLAYVADADLELWALDVSALEGSGPSGVEAVGRLVLPLPATSYDAEMSMSGDLAVRDGVAYVVRRPFHFQPGGLHLVDVREPRVPVQVGMWDPWVQSAMDPSFDAEFWSYDSWRRPLLDSDRALLVGSPSLIALDVAEASRPGYAWHLEVRTGGSNYYGQEALGLAVRGTSGWLAVGEDGVQAIDLSDPAGAVVGDRAEVPGEAFDVAWTGDRLLVADSAGLRVLDAATLTAIRAVEGFTAWSVDVHGGTAYVVTRDGILGVDVADPDLPVMRGQLPGGFDEEARLDVEGDLLAHTTYGRGLALVGLRDGAPLAEPTAGPTLTPWPTRTPGTRVPDITPQAAKK